MESVYYPPICNIEDLEHLAEGSEFTATTRDSGRVYDCPNGMRYPSVTTVIGLKTREHIKAWRARVGEEKANRITAGASRRGTRMHDLYETYLRAEEEVVFKNPLEREMFECIAPVLNDITPIALEAPLWSEELEMAGRVDCIGILNGELSIIDFKTSSKHKEGNHVGQYFLQETAYSMMVKELTGEQPSQLVTIVAIEGGYSQMFVSEPFGYIDELKELRNRYRKLYGF